MRLFVSINNRIYIPVPPLVLKKSSHKCESELKLSKDTFYFLRDRNFVSLQEITKVFVL